MSEECMDFPAFVRKHLAETPECYTDQLIHINTIDALWAEYQQYGKDWLALRLGMKIKYRGKQLGWRIYLRKGAIQIDLGGKSPNKKFPVFQVSVWDDLKQAYLYVESYKIAGLSYVTSGIDYMKEDDILKEELFYVNPRLIQEGCSNPETCAAVKKYIKEGKL
jgi:hypothetical protein